MRLSRTRALPKHTVTGVLQSRDSAYELASTQGKPPEIMRGARDTDSRISHNLYSHVGVASKTVLWVGAQIHLVVATSNFERLR